MIQCTTNVTHKIRLQLIINEKKKKSTIQLWSKKIHQHLKHKKPKTSINSFIFFLPESHKGSTDSYIQWLSLSVVNHTSGSDNTYELVFFCFCFLQHHFFFFSQTGKYVTAKFCSDNTLNLHIFISSHSLISGYLPFTLKLMYLVTWT